MNRITSILVILSLLALAALAIVQYEQWNLGQEQRAQLESKVTDLDHLFRQFAVLPTILSRDPRLHQALLEGSDQAHLEASNVLYHAASESDAAVAFLMDAQGLTIASSNHADEVSFVGNNYGFRPYFKQAIGGNPATFFAVGATTGIPGYFVSEPVFDDALVIGVIVVKIEPERLPVSWNEGASIAIVTDELGTVILSSNEPMLYVATRALDAEALAVIDTERRYELVENRQFKIKNETQWQFINKAVSTGYVKRSHQLEVEPWTLAVLTPAKNFYTRILIKLAALAGIALIIGLIWKTWAQQAQLSRQRALLAKRLEQQVEQRTRELEKVQADMIAQSNFAMLGRMSAAINHEINQPLASLRLNLAALRRMIETGNNASAATIAASTYDTDSVESTVVDLDRTAKRITRVIESLRALPNRRETDFSAVQIEDLLSDTLETLARERPVMSAHLQYKKRSSESQDSMVAGERVLLQQALLNVLYNAFDAVSDLDNPVIELHHSVCNELVEIKVADNGPGIPDHLVSRMFEPFESSPEKTVGLGLGLTLARQIINDHSGSLLYARTNESDWRTTFTIQLPRLKHPD